jgi:hypothetical protein
LLLILDPTDLNQRVQEARVAMLKAAKTMQELERWDSGAEVSRARRTFVLARQQVEQTERKVRETDGLVKKGILARNEYDIVAEQLTGFKAQLAAAADDLKATQEKADKSSMEIAKIEYEQARAKHEDLARSALLARIAAPRSGILSKAPASSGQAPATLDAGSRITKGQLLFNVGPGRRSGRRQPRHRHACGNVDRFTGDRPPPRTPCQYLGTGHPKRQRRPQRPVRRERRSAGIERGAAREAARRNDLQPSHRNPERRESRVRRPSAYRQGACADKKLKC